MKNQGIVFEGENTNNNPNRYEERIKWARGCNDDVDKIMRPALLRAHSRAIQHYYCKRDENWNLVETGAASCKKLCSSAACNVCTLNEEELFSFKPLPL